MPVVDFIFSRYVETMRPRLLSLSYQGSGLILLLLLSGWLVACAGNNPTGGTTSSGSASSAAAGAAQVSLKKLSWCGKPSMVFRDEGATSGVTPTGTQSPGAAPSPQATPASLQWLQMKQQLGFSVFLPETLPTGSCLMTAYGTVHDPILGSSFTIAYILPDATSLSLSEAPLRAAHSEFQCSLSSTNSGTKIQTTAGGTPMAAMQLCTGARATTNIVFSANWSVNALKSFFQALQTDIEWQPAT